MIRVKRLAASTLPYIAVLTASTFIMWLVLATGAIVYAHDALPTPAKPEGWSYPTSCCADYDCRQEADAAVQETPTGYRMRSTGEVIAYNSNRVRQSPDGRFHACWSAAKFDEGRVICLFAPPRAF